MQLNRANSELWYWGMYGLDAERRRWMWGETWYFEPIPTPAFVQTVWAYDRAFVSAPFGRGGPWGDYDLGRTFGNKLWPSPTTTQPVRFLAAPFGPRLNDAAPEAALRLQRVGGTPPAQVLGRLCYPILNDAMFVDRPKRRTVNAAGLQVELDAAWANRQLHWQNGNEHAWCVIYSRKTDVVTPVTSYRVMPNPVRLWQRFRPYPQKYHTPAVDRFWYPPSPVQS